VYLSPLTKIQASLLRYCQLLPIYIYSILCFMTPINAVVNGKIILPDESSG